MSKKISMNDWGIYILSILSLLFASCNDKPTSSFKVDHLSALDSYQQAREILKIAIEFNGGQSALDSINFMSVEYNGMVTAPFQGYNTDSLHKKLERNGSLQFNIPNNQYLNEMQTSWPYFNDHAMTLTTNDSIYFLNKEGQTYHSTENNHSDNVWKQRLTPLIFKALSENLSSLRYQDLITSNQKEYFLLSGLLNGNLCDIYINQSNYQIEKISYLDYHYAFGDSEINLHFDQYEKINGFNMALKNTQEINGHLMRDYQFTQVKFQDQTDFVKIIEDYRYVKPIHQSRSPMEIVELVPDVFLIKNILNQDYNAAFVNFNDFIVILEAPLDNRASQVVINEISKRYPDKPIQYLFISHFHDDHSGGFMEYLKQGTKVIVAEGDEDFYENYRSYKHTLAGYGEFQNAPLIMASVNKNGMTISDSHLTLEILNIGPTTHVENILIAYIPEHNLLFQGDLFRTPREGEPLETIRQEGITLFEYINSNEIKVDLLVGVHGPVGAFSDLERAMEQSTN
ncbi:MBL fold metallo-hydrolase [Portibacter marinus]|uniref:MBL fold metallo-hydrolase n=1 Tax=Portibacter marinus TaxID=2898660 RepID=UPI001F171ACC|nr:MBL fold metallo-hydrolase [Portibacter marinus]